MLRLVSCFVLATVFTAALTGCRVCSSPYDYCGPVSDSGGGGCDSCGGSCDPLHRSGSILNGHSGGHGYSDGYYSGTAQPQPYTDAPAVKQQSTSTQTKPQSTGRPANRTPTRAREIIPPPAPIPPQSSMQFSPAPLTREALLQQERDAVDATIIDVKDSVVSPISGQSRSNNKKPGVKQVSYEEIAW